MPFQTLLRWMTSRTRSGSSSYTIHNRDSLTSDVLLENRLNKGRGCNDAKGRRWHQHSNRFDHLATTPKKITTGWLDLHLWGWTVVYILNPKLVFRFPDPLKSVLTSRICIVEMSPVPTKSSFAHFTLCSTSALTKYENAQHGQKQTVVSQTQTTFWS